MHAACGIQTGALARAACASRVHGKAILYSLKNARTFANILHRSHILHFDHLGHSPLSCRFPCRLAEWSHSSPDLLVDVVYRSCCATRLIFRKLSKNIARFMHLLLVSRGRPRRLEGGLSLSLPRAVTFIANNSDPTDDVIADSGREAAGNNVTCLGC